MDLKTRLNPLFFHNTSSVIPLYFNPPAFVKIITFFFGERLSLHTAVGLEHILESSLLWSNPVFDV